MYVVHVVCTVPRENPPTIFARTLGMWVYFCKQRGFARKHAKALYRGLYTCGYDNYASDAHAHLYGSVFVCVSV